MDLLREPSSERQFIMNEALRWEASVDALYQGTHIKPWFIEQMREMVELEEKILAYRGQDLPDELLVQAKKDGFADKYLAQLLMISETKIREQRYRVGMRQAWDAVAVSGGENATYYYSTYNGPDRVQVSQQRKIMSSLGLKTAERGFGEFL